MSKNVLKSILFNSKSKAVRSSVTVSAVSSQFTVLMLRMKDLFSSLICVTADKLFAFYQICILRAMKPLLRH